MRKEKINLTTTPIKSRKDIEILKKYFLDSGDYRNYTLFVLGINTALRISDLIELRWGNVYDFDKKRFFKHIWVQEKKTKKQTCIALNKNCINALNKLRKQKQIYAPDKYIFVSFHNENSHISRNWAYQIIKNAAKNTHIEGNISCHSMRKTFGYHAWKAGIPPALIMHIYNHSSLEITKRYLSIEQDDKDEVFRKINL